MGTLTLVSLVVLAETDGGVTWTATQLNEVEEATATARELFRSTGKNRFQLAAARLEQCTTKVPDASECWLLLARAYTKLESLEKAKHAFGKFLELSDFSLTPSPYEQRYPWVDYPSLAR